MKNFFRHLGRKLTSISLVIFASLFLFLSTANPAMAFGSSNSRPAEGTAQMNSLQETSKQAVKSEPRSRSEVQSKSNTGLNGVQGEADLQKLNSPRNTQSAKSVREQAENALESITPGYSKASSWLPNRGWKSSHLCRSLLVLVNFSLSLDSGVSCI
jgi:hypothetical protein